MSKKNPGLDFLEDPDALEGKLEDVGDYFQQNRNIVLGIVGGIVLLVAGFFGYRYYVSTQDETAQVELFPSVYQLKLFRCSIASSYLPSFSKPTPA